MPTVTSGKQPENEGGNAVKTKELREVIAEIVATIAKEFPSFGGKKKPSGFNPLEGWMEGSPPVFALGADIEEVTMRVIDLWLDEHDKLILQEVARRNAETAEG